MEVDSRQGRETVETNRKTENSLIAHGMATAAASRAAAGFEICFFSVCAAGSCLGNSYPKSEHLLHRRSTTAALPHSRGAAARDARSGSASQEKLLSQSSAAPPHGERSDLEKSPRFSQGAKEKERYSSLARCRGPVTPCFSVMFVLQISISNICVLICPSLVYSKKKKRRTKTRSPTSIQWR